MIKSKAFQLVAAALAAGVLIGAAADRAISRADVQAMSDGEKNRQYRADLLSILLPSKSLYTSSGLDLQGDAWVQTRASATEYQSLCQRDTLLLFYGATEKVGKFRDRRALPYKLKSKRSYRFANAPRLEYLSAAKQAEEPRSPFAAECRKFNAIGQDGEWYGWFEASSPENAMEAGFAMLALQEWAKSPATEFVNCIKGTDPHWCKASVESSLVLDEIDGVETCKADQPETVCVRLGRFSNLFTIRARKTGQPMQVDDIISVEHEVQIIVT